MTKPVLMPREGCDRCYCGAKYWDGNVCVSCGEKWARIVVRVEAPQGVSHVVVSGAGVQTVKAALIGLAFDLGGDLRGETYVPLTGATEYDVVFSGPNEDGAQDFFDTVNSTWRRLTAEEVVP